MSTVAVPVDCVCGSIGRTDLRQCPEHFHLWNGDRRLTSVSRIVGLLPQEPCNACGSQSYRDHAAGCPVLVQIENAQARGKQVDSLFSAYVIGKLDRIPAGTRTDARDLFLKLKGWFDKQKFTKVESQVVVGDDEVGAIIDIRVDRCIYELKSVYSLTVAHRLQAAGQLDLDMDADDVKLLHISERFDQPKVVDLTEEDGDDFRTLRAAYRVIQRRTGRAIGV